MIKEVAISGIGEGYASWHDAAMQADTTDGSAYMVRRIYCVGRNYVDHIREMKEADERDPPFFFQKPADALVASHGIVPYPPFTEDLQYEVELVVAIGRRGHDVAPDDALSYVFGYAVGLDMTRRDRQREAGRKGLPWEVGKSFDHSAPCGAITPAKLVGHLTNGSIRLSVNGAMRQDSDISHMIWKTPEIVSNLSQQYELHPGDLIFTGTPAGVGPVIPGDRIDASISRLQPLSVQIGLGRRL
ncbi:MAG TPA: fumarylacetoacetate hydrolase family protein [Burkholderiales bacterium]|nr:fumarylacetoacetate hydrolase family protein [Burkholderiales bacterium]